MRICMEYRGGCVQGEGEVGGGGGGHAGPGTLCQAGGGRSTWMKAKLNIGEKRGWVSPKKG